MQLDMTDPASVEQAIATIVAAEGTIFGLVNNGGIGLRGCLEDVTDEEVRQLFETNIVGTVAVTRAVLPHMRAAAARPDRHHHLRGRTDLGVRRRPVLRQQVRAGGPGRGALAGGRPLRHQGRHRRAGDHQDRALGHASRRGQGCERPGQPVLRAFPRERGRGRQAGRAVEDAARRRRGGRAQGDDRREPEAALRRRPPGRRRDQAAPLRCPSASSSASTSARSRSGSAAAGAPSRRDAGAAR